MLYTQGNIIKNIYQEWKWKVNKDTTNRCSRTRDWDASYKLCMSSKLPKTKFVRYRKKSGSIPDWANPEFFQYNAPSQIESYRISCEGDSGSGQIFATQYTDRQTRVEHKKFVLSAVLTKGVYDNFYVKKFPFREKSYRLPCGAYTYSKKHGKYIQEMSISQKTTFPEIFNWIKRQITTKPYLETAL